MNNATIMDTVTSWFVASDGDKLPVKLVNTASQNRRSLLQAVAICAGVCFYMLLLLAWPHITIVNDSNRPAQVDSHGRPETLSLSFLDEDSVAEFPLREAIPLNSIVVPKKAAVTISRKEHIVQAAKKLQVPTSTEPLSEPLLALEDLFISVKTTKKFHRERLDVILKTWFRLARDQTYFFTDEDDEEFSQKTYNHLINTRCPPSHNRRALCCKMAAEFDRYLESRKKWWCHFDDDNYVNVPQLIRNLQEFDYREEWYLGKTSIKDPLDISGPRSFRLSMTGLSEGLGRGVTTGRPVSFWFATGGAGFCISQALAVRMKPLASNGRFTSIGDSIRLPDDVTMGFVVEVLLGRRLTVLSNFHSHLESLGYIEEETFRNQISFSYSRAGNVLSLNEAFDHRLDPTRFFSVHCYLFPQFDVCRRMKLQQLQLEKQNERATFSNLKSNSLAAIDETSMHGKTTTSMSISI